MSEGAGSRIPKTLADVSHLFFSSVEERTPAAHTDEVPAPDRAEHPASAEPHGDRAPRGGARTSRTRVLVVTGGGDSPGKSTVAVNLAQALLQWGRVALFDADPKLPNSRFYLGFPSWSYLSPVTGAGRSAPNALTDSGLIVVDWGAAEDRPAASWGVGDAVYLDVGDAGRQPLDYAVVDVPGERVAALGLAANRVSRFVVVAVPGWYGFQSAFATTALLARDLGVSVVDLIVNRAPDDEYAGAYLTKFSQATRDLLSVEARLLAGVGVSPGIGSDQRERGPIVRSRPDAAVALAFRRAAATAASQAAAHGRPGDSPAVHTEARREDEGSEVGAS